ncbi:very-long-chain (3R)-3-hydroxyacyl-CoA dehydratase 4 isoform X2 [Leopardus geoffroyi]|uniref:very-long-chain (3R)-3-hydroxyacyl-CoA dehydratase 4 isoform X2 n=1 Tax=Leopardus geoffroyi TaxID=46844 RepID=UPI001E25DD61|nr:very-long-chain (3R)-3-hydroxyacyl-CoA dehydratase 4 isoform X2 [Leopardus geoffroyi]
MALPAWLQPRYRKNTYLFIYYLIQFCGHSWIFTNMTVRFFSFGEETKAFLEKGADSMVDTFYAIGLVMRVCQSISLLELLHICAGIEPNHLLPRFLQLTERIIILFVVITSQEEVQEKYVVCVLFIFWNLLDMVRYTYSMLSVIGISYAVLTWLSQTLWMPIYPLCVLAEAFAIYQSLPYFESSGTYSTKLPFDLAIYFPYVLKMYLMMLFIGMYFTYSHLYSERRDVLQGFPVKKKKV